MECYSCFMEVIIYIFWECAKLDHIFFSWANQRHPSQLFFLGGSPQLINMNHTKHYHTIWVTSHWLHGNSILKIGCHYIWPGLIAFPRTPYLPIEFPLINHITKKTKKVPITWDLFSGGTFLDSLCLFVCLCLLFPFS